MLLIFDLDGTLFQAKPVVLHAARQLLLEFGISAPDDAAILKNAGKGVGVLLRNILPENFENARTRYFELLYDSVRERGELFRGAREAVAALYGGGCELVICSNSHSGYIALVLEHTGISGFFARYYSTEGYSSKAELVKTLVTPGISAAVIGDTHGDIEAAAANGLPSVAAAYGYGNKTMLAGAELTANSPEELVCCVKKLRQNMRIYGQNS